MPAPADHRPARPRTRPRRLALSLAAVAAVALGTVGASAAVASRADDSPDIPSRGRPGLAVDYEPTRNAPEDVNEANEDFAVCMRGEGVTTFPDFHAERDGTGAVSLRTTLKSDRERQGDRGGRDGSVVSEEYREAIGTCAPIMEKTGVTLPSAPERPDLADPADPADLPDRPDGVEAPAPREPFASGEARPSPAAHRA